MICCQYFKVLMIFNHKNCLASLMPQEIEPFPLKKVIADHKRAYEILKTYDDIDWICTAPPEIVNLPFTGTCKVSFFNSA